MTPPGPNPNPAVAGNEAQKSGCAGPAPLASAPLGLALLVPAPLGLALLVLALLVLAPLGLHRWCLPGPALLRLCGRLGGLAFRIHKTAARAPA